LGGIKEVLGVDGAAFRQVEVGNGNIIVIVLIGGIALMWLLKVVFE